MKKVLCVLAIAWCCGVGSARAQTPAPAEQPAAAPPAAPAAAAPAAAPVPITDADIKNVPTPKPEEKAAGDPGGTITGNAADIPVGDAKKGLVIADVVTAVGQNLIATNFVWTLVAGFLVISCRPASPRRNRARPREERQPTMMNFWCRRRHARLLADRIRHPGRRRRRGLNLSGTARTLNSPSVFRGLGLFRTEGRHVGAPPMTSTSW